MNRLEARQSVSGKLTLSLSVSDGLATTRSRLDATRRLREPPLSAPSSTGSLQDERSGTARGRCRISRGHLRVDARNLDRPRALDEWRTVRPIQMSTREALDYRNAASGHIIVSGCSSIQNLSPSIWQRFAGIGPTSPRRNASKRAAALGSSRIGTSTA